jgi:hypothetical protein
MADHPTHTTDADTTGCAWREYTDRLAADLSAERTGWDGQPLDEGGRRFYALRDSGYTGPIDQDGYPDTTSDDAATLRRMADRRGEDTSWWQSGPPDQCRAADDCDNGADGDYDGL